MIEDIFKLPYEHTKWLGDQQILINRLKESNDDYYTEQAGILEGFQTNKQCSIVMVEIMRDRISRHKGTPVPNSGRDEQQPVLD